MEYLFILCAAFSLLFFLLLITNQRKRYIHRFLIAINGLLVMSSLHIFLFYRSAEQFYCPFFSEINWAIPLLYGLLLWLYTKSLIEPSFKMTPIHWLHFVPFILFLVYVLIPLMTGGSSEFNVHRGYPILKLLINPFYLVAVVLILKQHDRVLKDQFSFVGKMHHYWLSSLAIGGLALWLISCISLIHHTIRPEASTIAGDYIVLSVLSIYMFAMSYVGFSKTQIFENRRKGEEHPDIPVYAAAISAPPLEDKQGDIQQTTDGAAEDEKATDADHDLFNQLIQLMETERPYLNPALSLHDLSESSHISSAKLSFLINQLGNKNFYDFINSYRVQAVIDALERGDTKNYSLLGIAEASGFNSKASFYRIFKKTTGVTPAQYAKGKRGQKD